jgi:Right handed beta helix region
MPIWILIFVISSVTLACATVPGGELEVDNVRGSDLQPPSTGPGIRPPYRTIQRAIGDAVMGDTIRLVKTSEPYRECIAINSSHSLGTASFPLVIEGSGATLDGTRALSSLDWTAEGRDLFELKRPSPGYVRLIAAPDQPAPENLGRLTDLTPLQPLQYARRNGSIFLRVRPGDVPQAYGLRMSEEQTGITLYDTSHIIIRNLEVIGFRLDGINCHDLVNDVRLENVNAQQNGRSGISVGGASQIVIVGGRLNDNGKAQLRVEGQSLVEFSQTKIEAGDSTAIEKAGGRAVEFNDAR